MAGAGMLAALTGGGSAIAAGLGSAGYWGYKEGYPVWTGEAEEAHWDHDPGGRTKQWKKRFKAKREQRMAEKGRDGSLIREGSFLDRVNERNRLAATVDEADDYEVAERFTELEEARVSEVFDAAMTFQFDGFEDRAGVTLAASTDTYGEAAGLAADMVGRDDAPAEQPSIFGDRRAFAALLDAAPERDHEGMVVGAMQEADERVTTYLDANHPGLVEQVGKERSLRGGDRDA